MTKLDRFLTTVWIASSLAIVVACVYFALLQVRVYQALLRVLG